MIFTAVCFGILKQQGPIARNVVRRVQIGPFKLVEKIGVGGMATVWSGVHVALGTPVAFKFMRPGRDRVKDTLLFLNEAKALARMNHPGIVRVYDAGLCPSDVVAHLPGIEAHSPYFVMEHAGRGMLRAEDITSWSTVRTLLLGLLDALAHAHARGLIHRDIKPANVLVDDDGAVRLTDFGISRLVDREARDDGNLVRGTPAYMAPESIAASAPPEGPWTDLYAVGGLAYWLTAGEPPFDGPTQEILSAHLREDPPELNPRFEIPDGFEQICRKMLRKEPQARFTRAADAARAIAELPGVRGDVSPPPTPVRVVPTMPLATVVEQAGATEFDTDPGEAERARAPRPPDDWRMPERMVDHSPVATGPGLLDFRESVLVGRQEARDTLWAALHDAWAGADLAVAIRGPEGIGRHAISEWFARRSHEVGATTVLRFDDDLHASMTDHLRRWCQRVGGPQGIDAYFQRCRTWDESEWERQHLHRLATTGEVADAVLPAVYGRWSARVSRERVVVFLAPSALAELFDQMRQSRAGRRLLVVAESTERAFDVEIRLGPMPERQVRELLSRRFGFAEASAKKLAQAAEGNPGAAMRWARNAIRNGYVERSVTGLELPDAKLDEVVRDADDWQQRLEAAIGEDEDVAGVIRVAALVDEYLHEEEFQAICRVVGTDSSERLTPLFDLGILRVDDDKVRFAHPDVRRSVLEWQVPDPDDHRMLMRALEPLPRTQRRARIVTVAGLRAGIFGHGEARRRARQLRASGAVDDALEILRVARECASAPEHAVVLLQEQVECHLSNQAYADARALLEASNLRNSSLEVLELFLALRSGEDVRDQLLAVDADELSETATRMLAYTWTDFGEYDGARRLLTELDPDFDQPGKFYALARVAFLEKNWREAERHGLRAAEAFESDGRPDGRLVALDLVASAKIELGQLESAIRDYRTILREADRMQMAVWAYRCNLAVALLRRDPPPSEVDGHLQSVVADCLEAGRRDVEHYARCAQLLYAVERGKRGLAVERFDALEKMGSGPWVIDDSLQLLERARESVGDDSLEERLASLIADVSDAL